MQEVVVVYMKMSGIQAKTQEMWEMHYLPKNEADTNRMEIHSPPDSLLRQKLAQIIPHTRI